MHSSAFGAAVSRTSLSRTLCVSSSRFDIKDDYTQRVALLLLEELGQDSRATLVKTSLADNVISLSPKTA